MASLFKLIKGLGSFVLIVCGAIFVGPILSASNYAIKPSSIAMNGISTGWSSHGVLTCITLGLIDTVFFGVGLGTSIQAANELYRQRTVTPTVDVQAITKQMQDELTDYHKRLQTMIAQEKQLLQPLMDNTQLLSVIQKHVRSLTEIFKTIVQLNDTDVADEAFQKKTIDTLAAIETEHKTESNKFETIKTVMNKISEDLKTLESSPRIPASQADPNAITRAPDEIFSVLSQPLLDQFIDRSITNQQLFNQIYLFIFTFFFLLFIHNVALWILQYMSIKNPQRWSSLSVVIALIIIGQSLALLFLLHMTHAFRPLSPVYLYTVLFLIRSLTGIRHYAWLCQ